MGYALLHYTEDNALFDTFKNQCSMIILSLTTCITFILSPLSWDSLDLKLTASITRNMVHHKFN